MDADPTPEFRSSGSLRSAWLWAGAKIGMGLLFLAAVIGIRVIQATPVDEASDPMADANGSAAEVRLAAPTPDPEENSDSVFGRLAPGDDAPEERKSGAQLVSCRFADGVRFMTASDCAMRRGEATVFESKKKR